MARPKPHPDSMDYICKELLVAPYECVMIGDSANDMVFACNSAEPRDGGNSSGVIAVFDGTVAIAGNAADSHVGAEPGIDNADILNSTGFAYSGKRTDHFAGIIFAVVIQAGDGVAIAIKGADILEISSRFAEAQ